VNSTLLERFFSLTCWLLMRLKRDRMSGILDQHGRPFPVTVIRAVHVPRHADLAQTLTRFFRS
jgi:hypothetical protein